mgnify:CR=1 FL=1
MATEKDIETKTSSGQTRRSFLAKIGVGIASLAIIGGSLGMIRRTLGDQRAEATQEFPDETSIFHPASDPRQDPRRNI